MEDDLKYQKWLRCTGRLYSLYGSPRLLQWKL